MRTLEQEIVRQGQRETLHALYTTYYGHRAGKVVDPYTGRLVKPVGACRKCDGVLTRSNKARARRMMCRECAKAE